MTGRSDLVDIEVVVKRETDRAWGVEDPNKAGNIIWLPKSQCEIECEPAPSKDGVLTCPEWLAQEKGLV